ncbi:hypothetical protein [Neomegalonema sp.]|uniref:hypothetical protein n=1 Tax=Neomegalonema sp. TaxID=2039713 RepID=UPI002618DEB3|nr:hypothetical protein [Neomegalonema sp.]MDD2867648.1 hypothetical protein [Neomegalonema sp.]
MKKTLTGFIALFAALLISNIAHVGPAHAKDPASNVEYKTVAIYVIKNGAAWYRIIDNGTLIVLSVKEAHDLGLSKVETVGHVVMVMAREFWGDVTGAAAAVRYVAVDHAYPAVLDAVDFTRYTVVPAASAAIGTSYVYTRDKIVPAASSAIGTSYEYAKDRIVPAARDAAGSAYDYTKDQILPEAREKVEGVKSWGSGVIDRWKK